MIAWGVDVSTKRIAIASIDHEDKVWSDSVDVPAGLTGARRLVAVRRTAHMAGWRVGQLCAGGPSAILVEDPTFGGRTNPPLIQAVGVTLEALAFDYVCPVLEIPVGTWKKESVGRGNAQKGEVMEFALSLGADPKNQDEADAVGIAVAAMRRLTDG